jgi:hypothetical protein
MHTDCGVMRAQCVPECVQATYRVGADAASLAAQGTNESATFTVFYTTEVDRHGHGYSGQHGHLKVQSAHARLNDGAADRARRTGMRGQAGRNGARGRRLD